MPGNLGPLLKVRMLLSRCWQFLLRNCRIKDGIDYWFAVQLNERPGNDIEVAVANG